ncbi:18203_t:CDS:2 [Cetraspora pellucida]|uniref:18203_t:CDS:1 n=1 Tax=Cetraspora pellucida TaxID=1433469 RepID=A0ACA9KV14_9GLOM|nr:18203_t:CDS:2 [Cetraspora pellucida]
MTDGWTSVKNSKNASRNYSSFGSRGKTFPRYKNNSTRVSNLSIYNGVNIHNTYPSGFEEPISPSSSGTISPDMSQEISTLPSYHIELSIECPFDCQPKATINNSTTLVDHLKDVHKLRMSNLHHVYLIIEEYLGFWAKEITKDDVKEQLSVEADGEKLPKDKKIRDSLQRDKLEPGKNWETFEKERCDSDEELHRDDSWDDWDEEESQPTNCLFCDTISPSSKDVMNHMKHAHGFDLLITKQDLGLDFYQTIILINYIRYKTSNNTCMACDSAFDDNQHLIKHMSEENCFVKVPSLDNSIWKDPKYLFPTQLNDPLLGGFEDDEIIDDNVNNDNDMPLNNPYDKIVIPEEPSEELKEGIKQLMKLNNKSGSNLVDIDDVYNDVNI